MNIIQLELLFIGLFGLCLGAYYIGKKKKKLLRCIGKSGALVTILLMIVEAFIASRRGLDI
jgi:hypothetical protein